MYCTCEAGDRLKETDESMPPPDMVDIESPMFDLPGTVRNPVAR